MPRDDKERFWQRNASFAILVSMFRHSSIFKMLLAFLLPLAFIWSWAACLSVCEEITARHNDTNTTQTIKQNDENVCSITDKADDCEIMTTAAAVQERKSVKIVASPATVVPILSFRIPPPAWSALLPEINQNSPPKFLSKPLFIQFCAFRI